LLRKVASWLSSGETRLTIISVLGDIFLTVMPSFCTRGGMTGRASETRFCTSTWAMSESMPCLNVTVRV
jgi:hypothetical protein